MSSGIRFIILASAAILILVAVSLSGQVLPLSGIMSPDTVSPGWPRTEPSRESSFILTVIPDTAFARPGDPVDCAVTITPQGELNEPITLRLDVDAGPVFKGRYNPGVMKPPFPRTYEYRVVIPPQAPAPLTVRGTLTAEGGGHREQVDLVLYITP